MTQSATVSGLATDTTYYWQVRIVTNDLKNPIVYLDDGAWWHFTTTGPRPPRAFGKTHPANGATGLATDLTVTWQASLLAGSYEVCGNTTPTCPAGGWVNVGNFTSTTRHNLDRGTTYYWQVRAVNADGMTEANGGTWWSYTTLPYPPGPFSKLTPANGAPSTWRRLRR